MQLGWEVIKVRRGDWALGGIEHGTAGDLDERDTGVQGDTCPDLLVAEVGVSGGHWQR